MGSTAFNLSRLVRIQSICSALVPNSEFSGKSFAKQLEGKSTNRQTKLVMENHIQNKPRILCLHGFRTSAAILQKLIGRWPQSVLDKLQLHFLDGPFPARGKSDVEGYFDPPFYEWYHRNEDTAEYMNFEECVDYIEEYMINHGPFDGLLGFSQGLAFTRIPKIKFLILISGSKFLGYNVGQPKLAANAFSSPIECPSFHIIGQMLYSHEQWNIKIWRTSFTGLTLSSTGETDFLKAGGMDLLESFVDPVVIYHPKGHIIPRIDDSNQLNTMLSFIDKIQTMPSHDQ